MVLYGDLNVYHIYMCVCETCCLFFVVYIVIYV